jgi:hypothetical protein
MHKEFAGICATIEGIDQPLQWQTKVMGGPSKFPSSFTFAYRNQLGLILCATRLPPYFGSPPSLFYNQMPTPTPKALGENP